LSPKKKEKIVIIQHLSEVFLYLYELQNADFA